jgi:hypothetical protein
MDKSQPVISVKGDKAWYLHGLVMRKCVCLSADEKIIAGQDWLKEIVSSGNSEELMVIRQPEFDAFRIDADEDWGPPKPKTWDR